MRDGTALIVHCTRGEQKTQTNTKLLKSNTVYFQQKVVMKTTLEKPPGKAKYGKKELILKLIRVDDKSLLGMATIDLADYAKCLERRQFSVELLKSQFPDALIDFYLTANPVVGTGRSYSVRSSQHLSTQHNDIATGSQIVQSTRNSGSFNFGDSRLQQAKQQSFFKNRQSGAGDIKIEPVAGGTSERKLRSEDQQ